MFSSQYMESSREISTYSCDSSYKVNLIWGTQINVIEVSDSFKNYMLQNFKTYLLEFISLGQKSLQVTLDVTLVPENLVNLILNYPTDILPIFEHSLAEIIFELDPKYDLQRICFVLVNGGYVYNRFFSSFFVEKLVKFSGVVLKAENVEPRLKNEVYTCVVCNADQVLNENLRRSDKMGGAFEDQEPRDVPSRVPVSGNALLHSATAPSSQTILQSSFQDISRNNTNPSLISLDDDSDIVFAPLLTTVNKDACANCQNKYCLELNRLRSLFVDTQMVKIQELPSDVPSGCTPMSYNVLCFEDFCDKLVPGERVEIVGILKVKPELSLDKKTFRQCFQVFVEMSSFKTLTVCKDGVNSHSQSDDRCKSLAANTNSDTNARLFSYLNPTPQSNNDLLNSKVQSNDVLDNTSAINQSQNSSIDRTIEISNSSNYRSYNVEAALMHLKDLPFDLLKTLLVNSIAPDIFSMRLAKFAILLQLLGGNRSNKRNTNTRSSINILLIGDPGIAKSQLLKFTNQVTKGMYTSGRGSSACGLTASVTKVNNQFVLEPGALVLSDNSVCCIDEFDKMNVSTKSVLHEVMEQQTISISKAGIVTTLNARCSILASCNPIRSKYDCKKSVIENINLPCTLLSRFDVVCVLVDKQDDENDLKIGQHIINTFSAASKDTEALIDQDHDNQNSKLHSLDLNNIKNASSNHYLLPDHLMAYVSIAKNISPKFTQQSKDALKSKYLQMRQLNSGKTITATTRQLESLIRLSEAICKMCLSTVITEEHVLEAYNLLKESMLLYCVDPNTGLIDMDLINTGSSSFKRKLVSKIKEHITSNTKKKITLEGLVNEFGDLSNEVVQNMINEDEIIVENGYIIRKDD